MDARQRAGEGIFGPSEGQLRDLADRAVDRLTFNASERIQNAAAAHARRAGELAVYGCAIAGGAAGGVVGGVIAVLKILAFITDVIRRRREKREAKQHGRG